MQGDYALARSLYEESLAMAAARQATTEDTFAAAWAEARAMTMEQAIEYALTETNVGDVSRR
jgi:hypothetical protein